ncbi:MAG: hypothetical protein WKF86_05265 [Acidimicrobiales bacterium]
MGRMVDVDDLVGSGEIVERLNAGPTALRSWRLRYPDSSSPVAKLGNRALPAASALAG